METMIVKSSLCSACRGICAQQQRGEDEVSRLVTGGWWPLVPGDQPASRVSILCGEWRVDGCRASSAVARQPGPGTLASMLLLLLQLLQ